MCKFCENNEETYIISESDYVKLKMSCFGEGLSIIAEGEYGSACYTPKYCPECGRKLENDEPEDREWKSESDELRKVWAAFGLDYDSRG